MIWIGATLGAFALGTGNLLLANRPESGRSIEGAILGGIIAINLYKKISRLRINTGPTLAAPLALAIALGRLGCFFSGLPDFTYGLPTDLPWGIDMGDGWPRHPVALYESLAMLFFLLLFSRLLHHWPQWVFLHGFHLFAGYYGIQRFFWEFLKPYATILGPLNLFHIASLLLIVYSSVMIWSGTNRSTTGKSPPP